MYGILKFSESLLIGIHSMVFLTLYKDQLMSVKEIALSLNVSESYVGKVLQSLVKAGYLKSLRGAKGGFILNNNAENTKLIDLYNLFDGKPNIKNCINSSSHCNDNCSLHKFVQSINSQFLEYFENTTILDIISSNDIRCFSKNKY